ncbi:fluoroquinolone export ABC transporter permease subunit [Actinorugispora endophytica]|uniref:Fluoroquinolone transport system permease protein n=1 Tax=Actinorugispora endophytica TaxID=1605990 RepID=A0A4R6ULZ2_9ACTN|nr:hypothetical protein [Actinorugispora endophytica]TDQ44254.1 fluoroquinolone transport system permease protein [Actinorugispora endophytica]
MNRIVAACALEARVEARYGIVAAAFGLAALWTLVLALVPAAAAPGLAAVLLLADTAGFGALFVVALLLFERQEGARDALAVSPLRPGEYVAVRVGVLTALSVLSSLPIGLVALRGSPGGATASLALVAVGVGLGSLLFLAVSLAAGARADTLPRFFGRFAAVFAPLLLAPLARLLGLADHPALFLVPSTTAAELIRSGMLPDAGAAEPWALPLGAAWLLLCAGAAAVMAARGLSAGPDEAAPAPARRAGRRTTRGPRGGAAAAFAWIDLRGTARDATSVAVLAGPLLISVAVGLGYPHAVDLVTARYGVDPAPYQPVALTVLILLHVPLMTGAIGGLRTVEDGDDGTLLLLRVSPFTAPAYLGYRIATTTAACALGLAFAVPVSGLADGFSPGLLVAVALAALQAPLLVLVVAASTANKVEALVAVKLLGAAMTLLPVALWWLPVSLQWVLWPLPPSWAVLAVPGYSTLPPLAVAAAGGVVALLAGALLSVRILAPHRVRLGGRRRRVR